MQILTDISEITNVGGVSIAPQTVTQATAGSSVSMGNAELMTGAVIDFGAISAGLTQLTVQIEEWSGTTLTNGPGAVPGNGATTWQAIPNAVVTVSGTAPGAQTLIGLRTQGWCRLNAVTAAGTTVNALASGRIFGMPRSSASPSGYSRSPSA